MLTDTSIRKIRTRDKVFRLLDSDGLYLYISPSGNKIWHMRYTRPGTKQRNFISLGTYPGISLKDARAKRDEYKCVLAKGVDPGLNLNETQKNDDTFKTIALEWFDKKKNVLVTGYSSKIYGRLTNHLFPFIGDKSIKEITARDVLDILRRIEHAGHIEQAHRVKRIVSQVFRYAIAIQMTEYDITSGIAGALAPAVTRHFASIQDTKEFGRLLAAMDEYKGTYIVRCAMRLAPLVFVRPGELRRAQWQEISFEDAIWKIPAAKMKMKRPHIVPLAKQSLAILKDLHPFTGHGTYVFPGVQQARCISENTLRTALIRMGYNGSEMTVHGFRSVASTLLHEHGYRSDAIERQLAHVEGNKVKAAYNYADYIPERIRMMQEWADYLDELKRKSMISRNI